MDYFHYRDGQLCAEQVAITELAARYGTPLYVYSQATLLRHYQAFVSAAQQHPSLICYAVKANSNLAVLNTLAKAGAGFDIVSGGELARVLAAGGEPSKVVFSGVAKTEQEIAQALTVGIKCFNVESIAELERIEQVAQRLDKIAAVSLRVNPNIDAKTHPYISTGLKENKFGIALEQAKSVYISASQYSHLRISGVDFHIGSQLTEVAPFIDALDKVLALIDELAAQGIEIQHLDVGGGLGVPYDQETPPAPATYAAAIVDRLRNRPKLQLVFEPGRAIAANAGMLVTKVEFLKTNQDKHFAIVDAGMNDLIRPALYQAWQAIIPVVPRQGQSQVYDIVGPVCETGDFLGKDRALTLEANDLLAVLSAGAYGFVMSSNYNSRPRAAEVMVCGAQAFLVREREKLSDLWQGEHILPDNLTSQD